MGTRTYQELPLTELQANPWNPRKIFTGLKYDELVASIKAKGVLEPILVRPIEHEGKAIYEIIAGERRYRASRDVAQANGGIEHAVIPVIIQDMSDDDAFDVMTIENLQRAELTELEEARSFKSYVDRKGPDAIKELSERVGIDPRYIRRRTFILSLPEEILESWDKGELSYGHLEQLLRVNDEERRGECVKLIKSYNYSVSRLKDYINSESPALKSAALFDRNEKRCGTCTQNTKVQVSLFGDDMAADKGRCLNPRCFKQRLGEWLQGNWPEYKKKQKLISNGFRFDDQIGYADYNTMHPEFMSEFRDKCKDCPSLVSLISGTGEIQYHLRQVCIDKSCYRSTYQRVSVDKKDSGENAPRVAWHGEFFREEFYKARIPEVLSAPGISKFTRMQILLLVLLISNDGARVSFAKKQLGKKNADLYDDFLGKNADKIFRLEATPEHEEWLCECFDQAMLEIVMQDLTTAGLRHKVASLIGIDLAREWRINKDYLQKKTIAEMLKIGEKTKIFLDEDAGSFLVAKLGKQTGRFDTCSKKDLISVFLESGVDLSGKVPDEILSIK